VTSKTLLVQYIHDDPGESTIAIASQMPNVATHAPAPRVRREEQVGTKSNGVSLIAAAIPVATPSGNVRDPWVQSRVKSH
jgi:hypothetical protein